MTNYCVVVNKKLLQTFCTEETFLERNLAFASELHKILEKSQSTIDSIDSCCFTQLGIIYIKALCRQIVVIYCNILTSVYDELTLLTHHYEL